MREEKVRLLYEMLRIRRVEEEIARRYPEQEMRCPVHLSIGQEAIAVGVCSLLAKQDIVYSNHRSHAHYLAKGGNLKALIAELYGLLEGCSGGRGGSMHTYDYEAGFWGATPIVAGTVPIAVGSAWASKLKGLNRVTVVFFGDGCFEEGVMHESLNFSVLHQLPILFICENNRYSVYSRLDVRQPVRNIYSVAGAHGLVSRQGDGNNVLQVCEYAEQAINDIKSGKGPQFLEFETFRWLEHCGPNDDDGLGYRNHGELESWVARCPVQVLKEILLNQYPDYKFAELEARVKDEIREAFVLPPPVDSSDYPEYIEYA